MFAVRRELDERGRHQLLGLLPDRRSSRRTGVQLAPGPLGPLDEFRGLVKAMHRAGIEVILDMVFNHTAEGDERGPTLSFRGLDNSTYYMLDRTGKYVELQRLRQHRQLQPSGGAPTSSWTACATG